MERYSGQKLSISSCVPCASILPSLSITMLSAFLIVDRRWAITSRVLPFVNAALNFIFIFRVGERCCLVKNDNRRVFKHHSRDCDTLFFAAGQSFTGFACRGVVPLRQLCYKFLALRGFCRRFYLIICCVRVTETDIFKQ